MSKLFCLLTVVGCAFMAQASYLMWQINAPVGLYDGKFMPNAFEAPVSNVQTEGMNGLVRIFFLELLKYDSMSIPASIPTDVWHGSTRKSNNAGF